MKPILSVFLATLVLLGSTSFMVGLHFCNGEIKAVSFLEKADGCKHKQRKTSSCHQQTPHDCCSDSTVVHEGAGFDYSESQWEPVRDLLVIASVAQPVVIAEVVPVTVSSNHFIDYDIPILKHDRTILNNVFLI